MDRLVVSAVLSFVVWIGPVTSIFAISGQPPGLPGWTLVWSDEFDVAAGSRVDGGKWSFDVGDGCSAGNCGWGNHEKEVYTDAPENVSMNGQGRLAITARVSPGRLNCYDSACRYTSSRIKTRGRMEQKYGRIEARIRLPQGQGLWPAFWMLGNNLPSTPWPDCGEIDIMEYRGSNAAAVSSAMHGPGYSGKTPFVHGYSLPGRSFSEDFHVFAIEWEPEQVRFYVDNSLHFTVTKEAVQPHGAWVFDHPFFVLLNLAVGGEFDGDPASDAIFPATMLIDYVRVYERRDSVSPAGKGAAARK